jgi:hypothetical protein
MRALTLWFLLTVSIGPSVFAQTRGLPAGWFPAGSKPADYEMAVDPAAGRTGGAAYIKAKGPAPDPNGFATIMQDVSADLYAGKRLRLAGYVKTNGITPGWVGLWMRIDGQPASGQQTYPTLGFDNMQNRPIKGTQDWKRYEIVLDVPLAAKNIAFGLLQSGPGQSWMDDLSFDVVDQNVPTTGMSKPATPARPANLDFNQR